MIGYPSQSPFYARSKRKILPGRLRNASLTTFLSSGAFFGEEGTNYGLENIATQLHR